MTDPADAPHVVILGGGFGGLAAAKALAAAPVRVTLVDRHNYHLFQPLLYQVATASLSPGDIASPIRWVLRSQRNVTVLLANAERVDVHRRHVSLVVDGATGGNGSAVDAPDARLLAYDYLIVATGATHSYFGHAAWAIHAPGLKTLDDALEIRRRVLLAFEAAEREPDEARQRQLLTFVIVGGGPTGVELAGALAEIARLSLRHDFRRIRPEAARVILVEGAAEVLPPFPARLRRKAHEALTRIGIEVRTGATVTAIDASGVNVGSERIPAGTVIWAAGVEASPIARSLGVPLDRAGRVRVAPTLAVPGHSDIFVVGDLCALEQDGRPLPGVAQVAMQGGTHAARNILRAVQGQALEPFRYRDFGSMAVIGRGAAVADIGPIKAAGFAAWMFWIFLHLLWLVGFRSRFVVLTEWAWTYLTLQRRARLITGERLSPGA